jgi:hypothetical protein
VGSLTSGDSTPPMCLRTPRCYSSWSRGLVNASARRVTPPPSSHKLAKNQLSTGISGNLRPEYAAIVIVHRSSSQIRMHTCRLARLNYDGAPQADTARGDHRRCIRRTCIRRQWLSGVLMPCEGVGTLVRRATRYASATAYIQTIGASIFAGRNCQPTRATTPSARSTRPLVYCPL